MLEYIILTYRLTQKKVSHAHFNAYKLKKIENMIADISETIKDWDFRFIVRNAYNA